MNLLTTPTAFMVGLFVVNNGARALILNSHLSFYHVLPFYRPSYFDKLYFKKRPGVLHDNPSHIPV